MCACMCIFVVQGKEERLRHSNEFVLDFFFPGMDLFQLFSLFVLYITFSQLTCRVKNY